jgi:hypothetical protein
MIRKKHIENIVMPRRDCPHAWEKWYVVCLVRVSDLDTTIKATRELKSALGIDVVYWKSEECYVRSRFRLRRRFLNKLCLPRIWNRGWNLLECTKIGECMIGRGRFLVMRQWSIVHVLMELVDVGFVMEKTFQPMLSNR